MADETPIIEPVLGASGSVAPEHFDQLYAANADPWDFETSTYEAKKYAATLASLPLPNYVNGLELGCSIGVFTQLLATRCWNLLATDVSGFALSRAQTRCASLPNVRFEHYQLPDHYPQGVFDLIVVSELGYYFSVNDLAILRASIAGSLDIHGHLLLVHFTGETSYPLTAAEVHRCFLEWPDRPWISVHHQIEKDYRLDVLQKL
ncbi:class I SAM-dependent DNA methyltransferase [Cyanobium gracile]|uniref:Nodulation protein S (NodS) n=1 Tax=Cyanobium gracile (strain ATCC 27147 / PCC 6307) TaxID=292564 RepID=K9P5I6_CYAGP|nr:SAM-dependent methyltransferase [Cyanobium gracile]AFY27971.1 Nodulation protein S (NodS) [Cyanobium gracile PCC 6307]